MTRQERDLRAALRKPHVYYVGPFDTTDVEPAAGYYVSRLTDADEPHGPFASRERAEAWCAEHA